MQAMMHPDPAQRPPADQLRHWPDTSSAAKPHTGASGHCSMKDDTARAPGCPDMAQQAAADRAQSWQCFQCVSDHGADAAAGGKVQRQGSNAGSDRAVADFIFQQADRQPSTTGAASRSAKKADVLTSLPTGKPNKQTQLPFVRK